MKTKSLIIRNIKMYFSDKGMVFSSMISPLILLVLYATFLSKVFRDSFVSSMPQGFSLPENVIDATVAGQLLSSLIAVSCITVAFCSNMLCVQDKVTGARSDFGCAPVKSSTLSISYYDLGYTTGEMAVKILNGEADISTMPIEYTDVTKKYNKAICDDLGLTVPEGYVEIEA